MILKLLAEAASDYYSIEYDDLTLRSKIGRDRYASRVRHICQWVACEVLTPQFKKGPVSVFWGVDRTAVYYGCRIVKTEIIQTCRKKEKEDLQQFIEFAGNRITCAIKAFKLLANRRSK
jgi:hypothetical protein